MLRLRRITSEERALHDGHHRHRSRCASLACRHVRHMFCTLPDITTVAAYCRHLLREILPMALMW